MSIKYLCVEKAYLRKVGYIENQRASSNAKKLTGISAFLITDK
jgi:hypothetical protein